MAEYTTFRSPSSLFQILPQGHDKALKQAFYNTAATLFVVFVCGAAIAVYYILEAFLRPLLWAVLCGTFLHPFKNTLTQLVQGWLKRLRTSGTPLVVGTIMLPFEVVDDVTESAWSVIYDKIKLIIACIVGLPAVYVLYYFGPLQQIFYMLQSLMIFVYHALGYFSAIWVWSLVIAYSLVVLFYWTPKSSSILRMLAIPVWVALLFHVATIAGPFRVPLVLALIGFMLIGFIAELNEARKRRAKQAAEGLPLSPTSIAMTAAMKIFYDEPEHSTSSPASDIRIHETPPDGNIQETQPPGGDPTPETVSSGDSPEKQEKDREKQEEGTKSTSGILKEGTDDPKSSTESKPRPENLEMPTSPESGSFSSAPASAKVKPTEEVTLTRQCFITLIWAMVFVKLWKNLWVIQLIPLFIIMLFLKKTIIQLFTWQPLHSRLKKIEQSIRQDARMDIIAPKPVRGLAKLILRGDHKVVRILEKSMDKTMSILIILLLLIGVVLLTFFMAVQVHRESMHLVHVTSNVLNNSLHPELSQWLPDGDDMQKYLDTMVGNAYLYGREWITTKIHTAFNGDQDSVKHMEDSVLQIWDQLYESWFSRPLLTNNTDTRECPIGSFLAASGCETPPQNMTELDPKDNGPVISITNITNIWVIVKNFKTDYSLNIMNFFNENIGIVLSVGESLWLVLKGNMNLAFNILWATLSLLLGGGTALLNFVLAAVVFLTTLFYLLASSGVQYKPVEWFSSVSPSYGGSSGGNKLGKAVEEAIGSVFMASLKMALFYGMFTWLTHTIFAINIVYIPAVLASVFGAIPFVGTYWAALPAIIELWLVNGESVQAGLLFAFHLLPSYVVDTAIYSEIKGGHPYLTGLAIAGGIYWLGLEGAIIGPILLCCLIVAVNVYSTMLKPDAPSAPATVILDFATYILNYQNLSGQNSTERRPRLVGRVPPLTAPAVLSREDETRPRTGVGAGKRVHFSRAMSVDASMT